MKIEDLEKMTNDELEDVEDKIDSIQQGRIMSKRRKIIMGIRKGAIDFKQSKTLMDFLKK